MSYISKYTGQEIDNLLDNVNNINITKTVLWEGDLYTTGETSTLSESLENFDYLVLSVKHVAVANNIDHTRYIPDTWIDTSKIINVGYGSTNLILFQTPTYSDPVGDVLRQGSFTFPSSTTICFKAAQIFGNTADSMSIHLTKVVGVKLSQTASTNSVSNPIGAIVSIMGTKAPEGYLICDGSILNINKYKDLANYFEEQFGTANHFGGDGVSTFAIPDLRNEFLRGYHGETEALSGEIGEHQNATEHPNIWYSQNSDLAFHTGDLQKSGSGIRKYTDTQIKDASSTGGKYTMSMGNWNGGDKVIKYTSRPTNVAVLYCIKY